MGQWKYGTFLGTFLRKYRNIRDNVISAAEKFSTPHHRSKIHKNNLCLLKIRIPATWNPPVSHHFSIFSICCSIFFHMLFHIFPYVVPYFSIFFHMLFHMLFHIFPYLSYENDHPVWIHAFLTTSLDARPGFPGIIWPPLRIIRTSFPQLGGHQNPIPWYYHRIL